jgi:hypothetical protein
MESLKALLTRDHCPASSNAGPRPTVSWRDWGLLTAVLVVLAVLNALIYLGSLERLGFPLDDAWIHQTYARNLGLSGIMAYNRGQLSSGSTAPLWAGLLALGYLLGVPHLWWAYVWGTVFSIASALSAAYLSVRYFGYKASFWWVGIVSFLEWHLAWAALSGMEVTFFTFLTLLYLWLLDRDSPAYLLGIVAGIIALARPEGFLLVAIYGIRWLSVWRRDRRQALGVVLLFGAPFLVLVSPLVVFDWLVGNSPFAQTVYAKYMVYGTSWTPIKGLRYVLGVIQYFVWGPLLLLAPFSVVTIYRVWRTRDRRLHYPLAWIACLIALYSLALPYIYHNGRYIMPLIPIILILGVEGLRWTMASVRGWRIFWVTYQAAVVAMVVALWINGASTFALEATLLHENHLTIARWIDENTPPDAVIATHDVGLLGYHSGRKLVDLAGLITPEAIPILHDQRALAQLCRNKGVSYVVVFTGYHPVLLQELNARLVLSPDADRLRGLGFEPFEVHEVQ